MVIPAQAQQNIGEVIIPPSPPRINLLGVAQVLGKTLSLQRKKKEETPLSLGEGQGVGQQMNLLGMQSTLTPPQAKLVVNLYHPVSGTLQGTYEQPVTLAGATAWEELSIGFTTTAQVKVEAYIISTEADETFYTWFDELKIEITNKPTAVVVQENQYYPFGLGMKGLDYTAPSPNRENKFQFNGKEKQTELGLNHYDFGARGFDYQINRTTTLDPHADRYVNVSPYSFLNNNPLRFIDPTGMDGMDMYYDEEKETLIQEGFNEFIQYLQNGDDDDKKKGHKNNNSKPNDGGKDKGKKQKDFNNKVNDFVKNNHHKYKVITFSIFEGRIMIPIGWSSLTFSATIALGYDGVNFGLLITPTAGIGLGIGDTYGIMGSINFFKANSLEDISGLGLNIGGFINALSIVDFSFELNAAVDLVNIGNWYGGLGLGNPINAGSWGKGAGAYIDAGWTFLIPIYQGEQIPEYLQGQISQSVLKEGFNTIKSIYPNSSNKK